MRRRRFDRRRCGFACRRNCARWFARRGHAGRLCRTPRVDAEDVTIRYGRTHRQRAGQTVLVLLLATRSNATASAATAATATTLAAGFAIGAGHGRGMHLWLRLDFDFVVVFFLIVELGLCGRALRRN